MKEKSCVSMPAFVHNLMLPYFLKNRIFGVYAAKYMLYNKTSTIKSLSWYVPDI